MLCSIWYSDLVLLGDFFQTQFICFYSEFKAHSIGDYLYVFGGWDDDECLSLDSIERYDPATNEWTVVPELKMPVPWYVINLSSSSTHLSFPGTDMQLLHSTIIFTSLEVPHHR